MNELGLTLVKVGDRRREDYGDIQALAQSIAEIEAEGGARTAQHEARVESQEAAA